jgi:hypothetical protein
VPQPLRLLFMESSPQNMPRLAITAEIQQIHNELQGANLRDRFIRPFSVAHNLEVERWTQWLIDEKPDLLHFSGHCNIDSELIVIGSDGQGFALDINSVVLSLAYHSARSAGRLKMVVLNACYSWTLAERLAEHIDIAIGMCDAIDDNAAVVFGRHFYKNIAAGRSVQQAVELSRHQMCLQRFDSSAYIPTLYHHSDIDPIHYNIC